MSWKEYRQPRHLKNNRPQVRIKADGTCFISSLAYNKFLQGYGGVVLCHDPERNLMGFIPVSGDIPSHARKIRPASSRKGTPYGARISAKGFFQEHGVDQDVVYDLTKEKMDDGKTVLVASKLAE